MAAELIVPQEIFDTLWSDREVSVDGLGGQVVIGRSSNGEDDVVAVLFPFAGRMPTCTQVAKDHIIEILNAGGKV